MLFIHSFLAMTLSTSSISENFDTDLVPSSVTDFFARKEYKEEASGPTGIRSEMMKGDRQFRVENLEMSDPSNPRTVLFGILCLCGLDALDYLSYTYIKTGMYDEYKKEYEERLKKLETGKGAYDADKLGEFKDGNEIPMLGYYMNLVFTKPSLLFADPGMFELLARSFMSVVSNFPPIKGDFDFIVRRAQQGESTNSAGGYDLSQSNFKITREQANNYFETVNSIRKLIRLSALPHPSTSTTA